MGAEVNALAAVNADINVTVSILHDSVYRAGRYAVTAKDAELFLKDHPAAFALTQCTGGTGCNAGCWFTGQAALYGKTGG